MINLMTLLVIVFMIIVGTGFFLVLLIYLYPYFEKKIKRDKIDKAKSIILSDRSLDDKIKILNENKLTDFFIIKYANEEISKMNKQTDKIRGVLNVGNGKTERKTGSDEDFSRFPGEGIESRGDREVYQGSQGSRVGSIEPDKIPRNKSKYFD